MGVCLDQNSHPPCLRFLKNGKCCIPLDAKSPGVTIGAWPHSSSPRAPRTT